MDLQTILSRIHQSNTIDDLAEIENEGPDVGEEGYREMQRAIDQRLSEFVAGKDN